MLCYLCEVTLKKVAFTTHVCAVMVKWLVLLVAKTTQVRILVTAALFSLMGIWVWVFTVWRMNIAFLYFKTSILCNNMCVDSEKSWSYDQVGHASAVIKMQAPSEDWTHDPLFTRPTLLQLSYGGLYEFDGFFMIVMHCAFTSCRN